MIELLKTAGYKIDHNNREAIEKIADYFSQPQKKGLLLLGYYGTGKTWLINIIKTVYPIRIYSTENVMQLVYRLGYVPSYFLEKQYDFKDNGISEPVSAVEYPACFDELGGQNDKKINVYGTEIFPMSEILKAHYEKKIKCHAISNYEPETLVKLYGGEVVDRFKEMFITVKFKGESRR